MKKTIFHIGMLAAAALAFFSCAKETESPYKGRTHTIVVTVDKVSDSKTAIVEGDTEASYKWTSGDEQYFHIYENGTEAQSVSMSLSNGDKTATFTAIFDESQASEFVYTAKFAKASSNAGNPTIHTEQSPELASFDPSADILIASPITRSTQPDNLQFSLRRVVSINKMTLKGLEAGEVISSVEIGSDKSLGGYYLIESKEYNVSGKKLTLSYNATVPANGEFPVYFICGPADANKLHIHVVTDKNVYDRNDFNSTIDFQVGVVQRFNVNLANYGSPVSTGTSYVLVENQADLVDGATYLIYGEGHVLGEQKTNNRGAVAVTPNSGVITIDNTVEAYPVIIEAVSGGYSIKDITNNGYLYNDKSDKNYLKNTANLNEYTTWSISISQGVANITNVNTSVRGIMGYNPNNDSPLFAAYGTIPTGGTKDLALYVDQSSIVPDTRTPVTLSFNPANPADLTLGDTFTKPTLTVDPSQAPVEYTVETVPANIATIDANTGDLTITAAGTITVTATVSDVTNYKPASASYSFTVVDPNVVDYVTLPWAYPEGDASATSAGIQAITGVTAEGLGSDYAAGNAPYLIKLDGTGDYFQIKTDAAIGQVSVKYKMIGGGNTSSLAFSESSDGNTWSDVQTLSISGAQNSTGVLTTSNAFDSGSRYVKIVFTKGSNVGIGGISISAAGAASITWNLESIAITTPPTKTVYTEGESFDPAGMVVKGHFVDDADNTNTKDEEVTGYTISPDGALSVSDTQVTITYQGKSATQNITVNAVQVTTIADVLAGGAGTYEVPDVLVYAVKGSALIIGDATGKMYAYKSNHGLSAGDVRTVSGSTTVYNDVYEFNAPTFSGSGTASVNHGTAVELDSQASALQSAFANPSTAVYVHAIGSQSSRNITTTGGTALYLSAAESATDGKTVEIYGYVYAYSTSHSNFDILVTSIEEYVDVNTPTVSVDPTSLNWTASEYGSANAKTIEVTLNGAASAGDYTISGSNSAWTVSKNGNTITVYPNAENSSTTDAKSITLTIAHADDSSVYQEVTCTQAKASSGSTKRFTLTISTSEFNSTSYAANNGSHSVTATATDSSTMNVDVTSNQIMLQSSAMQWQKNNGYLYNTTDLGSIVSVTVNSSAGSFTTYYGTSANPSSSTSVGSGNGFFKVSVGSATGKTSSVVVVFDK